MYLLTILLTILLKPMDDYIVITAQKYPYMITNDVLFNIAAVVGVISIAVIVVAYRSKRQEAPTKCGCGKSESGLCDGSHNEN